jgi:hypothetical protein
MEPSENLKRFLNSLELSYDQWRDGEGYDLEALGQLGGSERVVAEDTLLSRQSSDWRDIEALDALGTEKALEEMNRALSSKRIEVRVEAAERLARRGKVGADDMENLIIQSLDEVTFFNGMNRVLRLVEQYPSQRVRAKIRWCAVNGNEDIRVLAAAMYHFLAGCTESPFDWEHRPLYLRFGQGSKAGRELALQELDLLIKQRTESG